MTHTTTNIICTWAIRKSYRYLYVYVCVCVCVYVYMYK